MSDKFWEVFPDKDFCIENMISNLDYQIKSIKKKNEVCDNYIIGVDVYGVRTIFLCQVNFLKDEDKVKVISANRVVGARKIDMSNTDIRYITLSLN